MSHADVLCLLSLRLKWTSSDIWVTLREEAFNHGSTSGPPPHPLGLQPPTTAIRAGNSRRLQGPDSGSHFHWIFLKKIGWGGGSCHSPNPITSSEQCLQQGINPSARSPCSKPGRQRSGETESRFPLPLHHFTSQVREVSQSAPLPRTLKFRSLIACNCGVHWCVCTQTIYEMRMHALCSSPARSSLFDLICQPQTERPLNCMWHSYFASLVERMSLTSPTPAPFLQRGEKSNYHADPQLSQRGELNITHNSLGVPSGSVDGNVTLGCNNKGF